MSKWLPDSTLELILVKIQNSEEIAICSQQPLTYFNAAWGSLWIQNTAYNLGDIIHPPTQNGHIYECVVAGTSDSTEPGWGVTQDQEFVDGGVTWKTHDNYSLVNAALSPSDLTIGEGSVSGRALFVAQKVGEIVHTGGAVTHTALISNTTRELNAVSLSQTDGGVLEEGKLTAIIGFSIEVGDPE